MNAPKRLAVLSCPRGGTTYLHDLIAQSGVVLGHERGNGHGIVGFPFDLVASKGLDGAVAQISIDHNIVHVIRDPGNNVRSMGGYFGDGTDEMEVFRRALQKHEAPDNRLYGWVASREATAQQVLEELWVQWNRLCCRAAGKRTVKVSDIDIEKTGAYDALCSFSGLVPKERVLPFFIEHHHVKRRTPNGPDWDVDEGELWKRYAA